MKIKGKRKTLKVIAFENANQLRLCPCCETFLDRSLFHKNKQRKDGLAGWCKACKRKLDKSTPWGDRQRNWQKKRRKENPLKYHAWKAVNNALALGKLKKPKACTKCNVAGEIEAHHEDYSKPLDVTWICHDCHCAAHGRTSLKKQFKELYA